MSGPAVVAFRALYMEAAAASGYWPFLQREMGALMSRQPPADAPAADAMVAQAEARCAAQEPELLAALRRLAPGHRIDPGDFTDDGWRLCARLLLIHEMAYWFGFAVPLGFRPAAPRPPTLH